MNDTEGWQRALIAKKKSGGFAIAESFEELESMCPNNLTYEYSEAEFNFNHGQPLIRFPDGKTISIVDVDLKDTTPPTK